MKISSSHKNYSGMKVYLLEAIRPVEKSSVTYKIPWEFECECGETRIINHVHDLFVGSIKSCKKCSNKDDIAGLQEMDEKLLKSSYVLWKRESKRYGKISLLTFEQWAEIKNKPCYLCGKTIEEIRPGLMKLNGIDRVDSNVGYLHSNCMPCCKKCNLIKRNIPVYDLLIHVQRMFLHNFKGV